MKWHCLIPQLGSLDKRGFPSVVCSEGEEFGGWFLSLASKRASWLFSGKH